MTEHKQFSDQFKSYFSDRIYFGAAGIAAVIFAIVGAFDSIFITSFPLRLVFWLALAYATMTGVVVVYSMLESRSPSWPKSDMGRAAFAGTLVSIVLGPPARLLLGVMSGAPASPANMLMTTGKFFAILPLVTILVAWICEIRIESQRQKTAAEEAAARVAEAEVALAAQDAASVENAMDAYSGIQEDAPAPRPATPCEDSPLYLEAEDHYVKHVFADRVEIRREKLSEAMSRWAGCGRQVHRSYWIKRAAISEIARDGRRIFIRLKSGAVIPVGRSHEKAVMDYKRGMHG